MPSFVMLVALLGADPAAIAPNELDETHSGKRIAVEGVISLVGGQDEDKHFRLLHCKAKFLLGKQSLGITRPKNVKIVGDVRIVDRELQVLVASIEPLPTDVERFKRRAIQLLDTDYQGWMELTRWAERQSALYEDRELGELAREGYQTQAEFERRAFARDPAGLRRLKQRLEQENKLSEFDFGEFEHEILHAEYGGRKQWSADDLKPFLTQVQRGLNAPSGADASAIEPAQRIQYDKDPVPTYRTANGELRRRLARHWVVQLTRKLQQLEFDSGQKTALQLAEESAVALADHPEAARLWVAKTREELPDDRMRKLSPAEMDEVARKLEGNSPEEAVRQRLRWLRLQEHALREREKASNQKDAQTRFELANTVRSWFPSDSGEEEAARLLLDAVTIDPSFEAAANRLRSFGYRQVDGVWRKTGVQPTPEAEKAGAAQVLRIGLDADAVRKLLGKPDTISRVATASPTLKERRYKVVQQWAYTSGVKSTFILFDEAPGGELRVAKVRTTE